jgi:XTP/dITP diphosphohydrolase
MNATGRKIVLASGNAGKLRELQALLHTVDAQLLCQSELGIEDAEETGLSFIENAIIKARHASTLSGLPAIADDSGLTVDALGGAPGLYSARYAADTVPAAQWAGMDRMARDTANNQKLLTALLQIPDAQRGAAFHCVIVYLRHANDPAPIVCHGIWQGSILHKPVGDAGFGYDPLFFVPTAACSSAQLSATQKNTLSHRSLALQQLLRQLSSTDTH